MKAAVKESLRLNPVSIGVGRVLAQDAVFSGYHVPKGVSMIGWSSFRCSQPTCPARSQYNCIFRV